MTTYINENFDSTTVGSLPSGWSGVGSGTRAVSTDRAYSGTKCLKFTGSSQFNYTWNPITDTSGGNTYLEAKWGYAGSISSYTEPIMYLRAQSLPDNTNVYQPGGYQLQLGFYSGDFSLNLFSNYSGAANALVNYKPTNFATLWSNTDWFRTIFQAIDYPVRATEGAGQTLITVAIQRMSDGFWLVGDAAGTWTNTGVFTNCLVYYDAQGLSIPKRFASGISVIAAYATGNAIYCDDVIFQDVQGSTRVAIGSLPTYTPGNSAELQGTFAGSEAGTGSLANLSDNDFTTTWFTTATSETWVRLDLGSGNSATLTRILLGTVSGNETLVWGNVIEGANVSTGPWTALGTVPQEAILNNNQQPIAITAGLAYRYFRLHNSYARTSLSELHFEGQLAGSPTWQPVRPAISPAAGKYANGSTVAITCPTSGSSIYYTTNGTTPTTGSTLYTGAITLPSNAVTTVKAISFHASGTTTTSPVVTGVFTCPLQIIDDTLAVWPTTTENTPENVYDDRGILLENHFGAIAYDSASSKYLWIGSNFNTVNDTAGNQLQNLNIIYSSLDLYNWHLEGSVQNQPCGWSDANGAWYGAYAARPFMLINPATVVSANNKYWVSFWNYSGTNFYTNWVVATAPTYNGPWIWYKMTGVNVKFQSGFIDYDGTAYAVGVTGTSNTNLTAYKLDPTTDWLTTTGSAITLDSSATQEEPVLFKYPNTSSGTYFLISSAILPYGGLHAQLRYKAAAGASLSAVASTLNSASWTTIWSGSPTIHTVAYNAQCAPIFSPQGRSGFIMLVDSQDAESPIVQYNSRATMFPIPISAISGTTLAITFPATWTLDGSLPSNAGGPYPFFTDQSEGGGYWEGGL